MKRGITEPLPPAIRASIAAADAVLDAAIRAVSRPRDRLAWRALCEAVARLDREAAHVAGRVQLADQERGQRGGDEAGEEQRGEVVHGTETNR